ncbi:MAG TPA: hypothetical protein VN281_11280, partial [Verrucomicrobiae bacterium]|nr:hypothetical protein [Verrucomicrobiae bacterium]
MFALLAGIALSSRAALLQPVLATNVSVAAPASGGGASWNPIISPDGRYVLFASTAGNLATTGTNSIRGFVPPRMNVFLRDRTNRTTTLVSLNRAGNGGGNDDSFPIELSTNGQYALFESRASDLVPGDTNAVTDVFVRDLLNAVTMLVSVGTNGGCGNGLSRESAMTPDGRYVAFSSSASNLVAGDTNGIADIFVRDLQAGVTRLASAGAMPVVSANSSDSGSSESPEITPDGRYVAFLSTATNLVSGVNTAGELYVRDVLAGTTYWASAKAHQLLPPSNPGGPIAYSPVLSDDGQYVAFEASLTSLTSAGLILRYSLQTELTDTVFSNAVIATAGYPDFRSLDMTPDGRFIAFIARTNIATGITNSCIYVWDAQTTNLTLASGNLTNGVPTNSLCDWPILDATGSHIAFLSTVTNLTTNVVEGDFHLYVRDLQTQVTSLADLDTNGAASPNSFLTIPRLTPDGGSVAFDCTDGGLVTNDGNHDSDVFVRDLATGNLELISAVQPALFS